MKRKSLLMFCAVLTVSITALTAPPRVPGARAQEAAEVDMAEREDIHQKFELAPGAQVAVLMIAGPVDVEASEGNVAEVNVVRSAPTRADLNCYEIVITHTPTSLSITNESKCSIVKGRQRVMLKLPRTVDLSLKNIAGDVRISAIDGVLRLNSIAGHVTIGKLRSAEIQSLAKGLSMEIIQIGERGVHVSSITGGIDLGVSNNLNAELIARNIIGNVQSDAPDIRISTTGHSDYDALIGSGGDRLQISSVVGGIHIYRLR